MSELMWGITDHVNFKTYKEELGAEPELNKI